MSQLNNEFVAAVVVPNVTEVSLRSHKRQSWAQETDSTQKDLSSFHEAHFGEAALQHFAQDFLHDNNIQLTNDTQHDAGEEHHYEEEYYDEYEEDDGLGYYPDGAKRTLTDQQIAMFRHSELHALQRAQDKAQNKSPRRTNSSSPQPLDFDGVEEGELLSDSPRPLPVAKPQKKNKKKKRGSGNSNKRWEPDPERRKRTWDVVETGLNGLDYGETEQSASPAEPVVQRRRITYDEG